MAEILLGRVSGPSGFQRAVVIKRILRHLARKKDFVDMFLDEARIVASIRHPNVVHVHELGHEDDELFLVMEYLEGESTAGLMRRLVASGESLDFALCCYIVAEACSGVHAAHELADPSGKNLGVVHRDVTPHNVFIGYGGGIKVLDFGIATASEESGRLHQTEAGQFKGKLEYASPEQCRGKTLDRRSDVFSLGTILWELTTGMRLFKRPSALEMAKAICEKPIPAPRSIVKDYPAELEAVVMKALARARKDRYQTALELRRDLLGLIRKLSTSVSLDEDLAALMRRLFSERLEEKAEMLRSMEGGSSIANIPVGEADAEVQIPVAKQEDEHDLTETDSETDSHTDPTPSAAPDASLPRKHDTLPTIPRDTKGGTRKMGPDEIQLAMRMAAAERERKEQLRNDPGAATATGSGSGTATGTTSGVATPADAFRPSQLSPRVPRAIMIAGGVFAVVGIVLIAFSIGVRAVSHRDDEGAAAASGSPSASAMPSSSAAEVETATATTTASVSATLVAAPPASTPAPIVAVSASVDEPNVAPTETTVRVETVPSKAAVYVNGTKKGLSPVDVKVARGTTPLTVEIRQPGFVPVKERVVPDANQKLRITLVPAAASAPSAGPYHRFD